MTVRRHLRAGETVHDVDVAVHEGRLTAHLDGRTVAFDARLLRRIEGGAEVALVVDGGRSRAIVVRDGDVVHVQHRGRAWKLLAVSPRPGGEAPGDANGDPCAVSPMTGVVRKVLVRPGDRAAEGATLFVVEAMKMEFAVPAPREVVVDEVLAAEGARVEIQQVIVTFRAEEAS